MILKIVVGIPAFNEEKNIAKIIVKLQKVADSIIVCNDGSTDLTKEICERMGVEVINHTKNLGYGAGIRSIFLKAADMDSDILVTFDADGQHRIEDIASVIEPITKNNADIVIGSRFLKDENSENVPKYRKIGIKAITSITDSVTNLKLTDSQSGFRAYTKKVLKEIIPSDKGMGVSTEILIKASQKKFKVQEVPIKILYEGDKNLFNQYGAILVNPEKCPYTNEKESEIFLNWLLSKNGQETIQKYKVNGIQLFYPNAN